MEDLVRLVIFLARTGFPLGDYLRNVESGEVREWCEVVERFWVDLDVPEVEELCNEAKSG